MNVLVVIKILSLIQLCCNHFSDAKTNRKKNSHNKNSRDVESFTTILLDNEFFSLSPDSKRPMNKYSETSVRRKEGIKGVKEINNDHKTIKGRNHNVKYNTKIKSHHPTGSLKESHVVHNDKVKPHHKKLANHQKITGSPNKKLHKRQFDQNYRYYNKANEVKRDEIPKNYGPTYRFILTEVTTAPKHDFIQSQAKRFLTTAITFGDSYQNELYENLNANRVEPLAISENPMVVLNNKPVFSSSVPIWSHTLNSQSGNVHNFYPDSENLAMVPHGNIVKPFIKSNKPSMTTTSAFMHTRTFHQADIIQRNLEATSEEKNDDKEDSLSGDESNFGDIDVTFAGICDHIVNQTCCVQREIGDVLTLAVKINSSRKANSFQVRWMKVYHKFDTNKGKPIKIEPAKLPWNMVSGSEGKELRLNPVTNSDTDPNCFIATIFLITRNRGKILFTQLKKLVFHIEIPIIDMGKIYAGEELSINVENFISLPERGNLIFQWNLETKPEKYEALPSNIKVSNSGRSVVLKELKKGRLGVLNCVIYSSNRYAVAKRRFDILNIVENVKRRSAVISVKDDSLSRDLQRNRRCRHVIRRSQEKAKQRLKEGNKPKSRKKRFRRMKSIRSRSTELECESLRKKMYSRLIRSPLEDFSTEDPRLMPLEKLFELSEEGDGTLDDVIPHEVHYVSPKVKLISGTSGERSVDHPISTNCTSHFDCGENAICVFSEEQTNSTVLRGNCYCRPEFYRDDNMCRKIPPSNHREKRLKRNARNDFAVPQHLFYVNSREIPRSTPETLEVEDENTEQPKILAFEEEESFLLTNCIDDKDCSMHANCVQPNNGHPFCKCRPGFRGNGIFCWEVLDYVPAEEQFLTDKELDTFDQPFQPRLRIDHMAVGTAEPQEIEEDA